MAMAEGLAPLSIMKAACDAYQSKHLVQGDLEPLHRDHTRSSFVSVCIYYFNHTCLTTSTEANKVAVTCTAGPISEEPRRTAKQGRLEKKADCFHAIPLHALRNMMTLYACIRGCH